MKKYKAHSFINIFGLAIGIAVCILIFLFVEYELGFDSHITNKNYIYRVVTHINRPEGIEYNGCTPFPMAAALRENFPECKQSTQVYRNAELMVSVGEDRFYGETALFLESHFFELFDMEWIRGNLSKSFNDSFKVILTKKAAHKYFGDTNVLGKILNMENKYDLIVEGVVANPPQRTSLPYDMLISWKTLHSHWDGKRLNQWDLWDSDSYTFVLLGESVDVKHLQNQFASFEQKYMEPDDAENCSFWLQPLSDIHFDPHYGSYNYVTSRTVLSLFSAIGFLILVIACINFINLNTAQTMKRKREIGMRKVLGAHRTQLVRQLLGETSLFTLSALLTALFLAEGVLPYLEKFLGNNTEINLFSHSTVFIFLGIVTLLVTCCSGLYPAIVLTRYQPAESIKERSSSREKKSFVFRNNLVLIQFIISQILIVGTLAMTGQMKFMSKRNLGFRSKEILTVSVPKYEEKRCELLRSLWMQNPRIREVSFAWTSPISNSRFQTSFQYTAPGGMVEFPVYIKMSDSRYPAIYGIPILAGQFFEHNVGDESHIQWVVSEMTARRMGLTGPQEAVGKRITVNGLKGEIIGVIGDFHGHSLRREIQPMVFFNIWPGNFQEAQILLNMENIHGTISHIRDEWKKIFPEQPFQYVFLDDYIKRLYEKESRLLTLIQISAFLSILIGCLGLLGLVSFVVLQRTKEVGIRKVLGATVTSVYFLISRNFFKWILLANIAAWPIAYLFLYKWLQEFAYRTPLSIGYFIIGGIISIGAAAFVMSFQVIRIAISNPVKALRYE